MARQMKVACIITDGFEDSEFRVPYDRLRKEGLEVVIIGPERGKEIAGKKGKERIRTEASIGDVEPGEFDLLFIPGGYSPDHLRVNPRFVEFVRAFDVAGKPIAAICHGPQLLMTARLVKGRTLTAWKTIQDDLELAGANVVDEPVVVDRNWITSRKPDDIPMFCEAVVDYMHGRRESGVQAR